MERFTISKSEKQTIYEIYRACRICGAGGGYRMPIIQNIIDLETSDVELRQKIQECLQLEVRPDDRMPPLICELCVDKVNDFYEFFNLARQTNVRTRTRLGLPVQTAKKGETDQNDCILGVTEPIHVKDDDSSAKKRKAGPKSSKIKKEPEAVSVKVENTSESSSRSSSASRSSRAAPSPTPPPQPPPTRRSRGALPPPAPLPPPAQRPGPKSRKMAAKPPEIAKPMQPPKDKKERKGELQYLLEDSMKYDDTSTTVPRSLKRTREEPPTPPTKRANRAPPNEPVKDPTPPPPPPPTRSKPGPKSKKKPEPKPVEPAKTPEPEKKTTVPVKTVKTKAKPVETPPKVKEVPKPEEPPKPQPYKCLICEIQMKNSQAFSNHMRSHVPSYTKVTHACNPCGMWFGTSDEAAAHHRFHRAVTFPYHCRRCFGDYRTLQLYNDHITSEQCTQWVEQPDVKCEECWATFPTDTLRTQHRCPGRGGRPGGKCSNCSRTYATVKTLKKHESSCRSKKKQQTGDLIADPDVLRRLKPMRVRITKCDDLLVRATGDYYNVSAVKPKYGLAKNYVYPYLKLPVKAEPLHRDSMVAIPIALKEDLTTENYTHWDSDESDTETFLRKVPNLSTLAIKKIFSNQFLGKVPKRRKIPKDEVFENENDFDNISTDINDIINSLGDDMGGSLNKKDLAARIKDIIGCFDDDDDDNLLNDEIKVDDGKAEDKTGDNQAIINESTKENVIESNEIKINNNREETSNVDVSNLEVCHVSQNDNLNEGKEISRMHDETENHSDNLKIDESSGQNETEDNSDDGKKMDTSSQQMQMETETNSGDNKDTVKSTQNEAENYSDDNKETEKAIQNVHSEIEDKSHVKETETSLQNTQNETENNLDANNREVDISLPKFIENDVEMADKSFEINRTETREPENVGANGINNTEKEISIEDSKDTDCDQKKKETSKVNKESPIKHSIENLIGETEKNPEKYISEVISSIEDIINKNPKNEEINQNHDLNGQINDINDSHMNVDENINDGRDKRLSDNDKITLEDLLPKEDRSMELDDISDEDFNFDA